MLKEFFSFIAIILLSVYVILFTPHIQDVLHNLLSIHDWVANILTHVFTDGEVGDLVRKVLALLVIPFFIAFIPYAIYWIVRKKWLPHFMLVVWFAWFQLATLVTMLK